MNSLNADQQKIVEYIRNWWQCNQMYLVIDAPAGVGKTYTINKALKQLPNCEPILLCPTNEALHQLIDKTPNPEKYTFKTVHSALGISPTVDKKELEFEHVNIPSLWDNFNLCVIDEGSMLNDFLLDLLISIGIKIIFVGHSSQLPPVVVNRKRNDPCVSPVFEKGWEIITLRQPMRNTGKLWEFCNEVEKFIYSTDIHLPNDYNVSRKDLNSYMTSEEGKKDFLNGDVKVVAWTNNGVNVVNSKIRELLFGEKSKKYKYLKGDKIILTKPYTVVDIYDCSERELKSLTNKRDDLEVLYSNTKATVISSTFVKVTLNKDIDFWCYKIKVDIDGGHYYLYEVANYYDYQQIADYYEHIAWNMKTPQAKAKAYKTRHFILSCLAEIKHYYAATSHRLQGTSIPNVIVMYHDIMKNPNRTEKAKCLYVACSRAINNLMIYRGVF